MFKGFGHLRPSSKVVMLRIANPSTPVRFRPRPPLLKAPQINVCGAFFMPADCHSHLGLGQIWDTKGNCVSHMSPANSAAWPFMNSVQAAHGGQRSAAKNTLNFPVPSTPRQRPSDRRPRSRVICRGQDSSICARRKARP